MYIYIYLLLDLFFQAVPSNICNVMIVSHWYIIIRRMLSIWGGLDLYYSFLGPNWFHTVLYKVNKSIYYTKFNVPEIWSLIDQFLVNNSDDSICSNICTYIYIFLYIYKY